jgi:hypothetical protein
VLVLIGQDDPPFAESFNTPSEVHCKVPLTEVAPGITSITTVFNASFAATQVSRFGDRSSSTSPIMVLVCLSQYNVPWVPVQS